MGNTRITASDRKFLKSLGAQLRAARTKKGLTLEEAEGKTGINWTYLQKVEAGQNVTAVTLKKIADGYGVSLAKLLDGSFST